MNIIGGIILRKIFLVILLICSLLILFCVVYAFCKSLFLKIVRKEPFLIGLKNNFIYIFLDVLLEALNPLNWF